MVFCPFWPVFLFPLPGLKALTSIDVVRGAQVELKASSNSNIEQSGSTVIWNFISDSIVLVSAWWNPAFPKCFCLCVCVYTLKIRTLMCTKTHQMILNNITINKKIKKTFNHSVSHQNLGQTMKQRFPSKGRVQHLSLFSFLLFVHQTAKTSSFQSSTNISVSNSVTKKQLFLPPFDATSKQSDWPTEPCPCTVGSGSWFMLVQHSDGSNVQMRGHKTKTHVGVEGKDDWKEVTFTLFSENVVSV